MYSFQEFADELKKSRESKELTIEQVSSKTKIDLKFLEAMELGDFAFLPEIYVKAFVKQYAKALDLDEEEMQKKYTAAKSGSDLSEMEEKIPPVDSTNQKNESMPVKEKPYVYDAVEMAKSNLKNSNNLDKGKLIIGSVIIILVVLAIVYFFFTKSSKEIIVTEKPIEQVIKENESRYKVNTPAPKDTNSSSTASSVKNDSLSLSISANDTSWIRIVADDSVVDDFIMFPQSQKTVEANNNYKITFGNSGAIQLKLNNKKLDFEGKNGKVKYVLINKRGLKYLEMPTSK